MFFSRLSLTNFRNYEKASFSFDKKINCIVGQNGTGKTNLLDAIYYLCLTKSYLNGIDQQNIRHGENFFMMQGDFSVRQEPFSLKCTFSPDRNKEFLKNGVKYEKLSEHVGLFPVVFITPYDISLVQGGSEERRRFLDGFISQLDHEYLERLQQYNRLLAQRNALLKNTEDRRKLNKPLLQVYNEKMIPHGSYIFEKRRCVVEEFVPVF